MNAPARPTVIVPDFDAESHTYRVDGQVVPSVTEILGRTGLTDFRHLPPAIRQRALRRGSRVHKAGHYLIEGTLDWSTVDDVDRGYVESCSRFLEAAEMTVVDQERLVYHPHIRFAGTTDAIGIRHDRLCVADWCCGDLWESAKDLQTSAYAAALVFNWPEGWWEFDTTALIERVGVHLQKDGSLPKVEPYRDPMDFRKFQAAAVVVHEQNRRRKRGVGA